MIFPNSHNDFVRRITQCADLVGWDKTALLEELVDAVAYLRCEVVVAHLEHVASCEFIGLGLETERTASDIPD